MMTSNLKLILVQRGHILNAIRRRVVLVLAFCCFILTRKYKFWRNKVNYSLANEPAKSAAAYNRIVGAIQPVDHIHVLLHPVSSFHAMTHPSIIIPNTILSTC